MHKDVNCNNRYCGKTFNVDGDHSPDVPEGTSPASGADQFGYDAPVPAVTGVRPNSGVAAGGDSVQITGSGFTGVTGVSFGGMDAASFSLPSSSK